MRSEGWEYQEWSDQCEDKDWVWFSKLAQDNPNIFGNVTRSPQGRVFDVCGKRNDGSKFIYELKGRQKKYTDCFIEIKKYLRLKQKQKEGYGKPIYICFFNNGADAYIWDLTKPMTGTVHLNWWIKRLEEPADRIGLQFQNATHFQFIDGKYLLAEKASYQHINDDIKRKTLTIN